MKILVIGGSSGIGKLITECFSATSISKSSGYCVPDDNEKIVNLSFDYDVIINCLPDENQNVILELLWEQHKNKNLKTYFITLGSMSWRLNSDDHPKNKLQKFSETTIFDSSQLRHTLVNPAWCFNSKNESPVSVVTESQITDIFKFLLDQYRYNSVISLFEIKGK